MDPQRQALMEIADGDASVKRTAFMAVLSVFFGLAIISAFARAAIRFVQRRTLGWDDYLLFGAAACLVATTGIVCEMTNLIYIWTALRKNTSIRASLDPSDLQDIIGSSMSRIDAFNIICWTAIFLVKASFLAFFKQLIWQVSRIQTYYWVVVAITVFSWMLMVASPFIMCPEFGMDSVKCLHSDRDIVYISMSSFIAAVDVLTYLLIVSIPIILIRRSNLRLSTKSKLVLGVFLSLSLFMVAFALLRVAKIDAVSVVDIPWEFFWQTMEANIAVIMGSLTVFRSLLVSDSVKQSEARRRARAAGPRSSSDLESQPPNGGEIPTGTMTGLRSFFWGNKTRPMKDPLASITKDLTVDDDIYLGQKARDLTKSEKPEVTIAPPKPAFCRRGDNYSP